MSPLTELWSLPGMPSREQFFDTILTTNIWRDIARANGIRKNICIVIEDSEYSGASVQDELENVNIFIPCGIFLRSIYFFRVMLMYMGPRFRVNAVDSPFDDFEESHYTIPDILKPALLEFGDVYAYVKAYKLGWNKWDDGNKQQTFEGLLMDIAANIICHELAHYFRGHFRLRNDKKFELALIDVNKAMTRCRDSYIGQLDKYRAFEIDADYYQGRLIGSVYLYLPNNTEQEFTARVLNGTIARICMLSIFDAKRRQAKAYTGKSHLAPIVRNEIIARGIFDTVLKALPVLKRACVTGHEVGWQQGVQCLRDIDGDCATGRGLFETQSKTTPNMQTTTSSFCSGYFVSGIRWTKILEDIMAELNILAPIIFKYKNKI